MTKLFEPHSVNVPKPFTATSGDVSTTLSLRALAHSVGPSGEDQVYTGAHSHLNALALEAGATEYASQVENIRTLVQSGRYQVDHGELGGAIVNALLRGY